MTIINTIVSYILSLLDALLPSLGVSSDFMTALDTALAFVINLVVGANWFIDLNILVMCFATMTLVDNWSLLMRIGQWIIRTVRG